jgi:hypothetical protein
MVLVDGIQYGPFILGSILGVSQYWNTGGIITSLDEVDFPGATEEQKSRIPGRKHSRI